MANYKRLGPNSVGTNNVHVLKAGEVVKVISIYNAGGAVANSLATHDDNTTYQVTSGKTFHVVEIHIMWSAITAQFVVFTEGDTEDAETNARVTLGTTGVLGRAIYPTHFELASGKFAVYNPNSTGCLFILMIGYET